MAAKTKTSQKSEIPVEQYLNGSSEHDNSFMLSLYLDAIKTGIFPEPENAVRIYAHLRYALVSLAEHPEKVIAEFDRHTGGLTIDQKLFLADNLDTYFRRTVFGEEENYLDKVSKPLSAYLDRLKIESGRKQITSGDLRQTLQELFQKEIANLPAYFEQLTPKERMNFLCKLMPFIMSRAEPDVKKSGGLSFDWL